MQWRHISGKLDFADVLKASNQNNRVDLTAVLGQFYRNMNMMASTFSALADSLNEPLKKIRHCKAINVKLSRQTHHFLAQCRDALESESLAEMIQKRDVVLKQRKNRLPLKIKIQTEASR